MTVSEIRRERENKSLDFSPNIPSRIILFLVRWRAQVPGWRIQTMAQLARSELDGIDVIESVVHEVSNRRIRLTLEKHLEDERRHAQVFTARLHALQREAGLEESPPPPTVHGVHSFSLMTLVAYLETQEKRAIPLLQTYAELYAGDEQTVGWIEKNIGDEVFHATWTHRQLERWIDEGMAAQVKKAREEARALDRRAFWMQLFSFLKVAPWLLMNGYFPALRRRPAPMELQPHG